MDGDRWISGTAFPSAADGYSPHVHPILFADSAGFLGSSTMGMANGPFCQLFGLAYRADPCQRPLTDCGREPVFRATRSVRSSGLAVLMGWRVVYRPDISIAGNSPGSSNVGWQASHRACGDTRKRAFMALSGRYTTGVPPSVGRFLAGQNLYQIH